MMRTTVWFESVARKYWLCWRSLLVRKDEHKTVLETSHSCYESYSEYIADISINSTQHMESQNMASLVICCSHMYACPFAPTPAFKFKRLWCLWAMMSKMPP